MSCVTDNLIELFIFLWYVTMKPALNHAKKINTLIKCIRNWFYFSWVCSTLAVSYTSHAEYNGDSLSIFKLKITQQLWEKWEITFFPYNFTLNCQMYKKLHLCLSTKRFPPTRVKSSLTPRLETHHNLWSKCFEITSMAPSFGQSIVTTHPFHKMKRQKKSRTTYCGVRIPLS